MGPYGGWGNVDGTPRGLEWAPYGSPTGPYGDGALYMGPYGGWGNMEGTPWGLEWAPYGSSTGPYTGALWSPMGPHAGWGNVDGTLGLRMVPLWEPYGALRGLCGALWGPTGAGVIWTELPEA